MAAAAKRFCSCCCNLRDSVRGGGSGGGPPPSSESDEETWISFSEGSPASMRLNSHPLHQNKRGNPTIKDGGGDKTFLLGSFGDGEVGKFELVRCLDEAHSILAQLEQNIFNVYGGRTFFGELKSFTLSQTLVSPACFDGLTRTRQVSTRQKVPDLPMPAEQWTTGGPALSRSRLPLSLTAPRNSRKVSGHWGTPKSGQVV